MKRIFLLASTALFAAAASGPAFGDEGMWTFDNFPTPTVNAKYNLSIDQKWLDHVRLSAVRLGTGCSASVVTKTGLVLTNDHCVRTCVGQISTAEANYIKDGFAAAKREDEKLCAGMQAEILEAITDVTATIDDASKGKSGHDFVRARDMAIAKLEKDGCAGREAKYRCQVISLYQGGQFKLYTYRKFNDVRLVFAPETQIAFFGGDPDNFNFPRYNLDFGILRLYDDGKPVATPNHLSWSISEPKAGAPMFVAGNPGSTGRLLTLAQLEQLRNFSLPDNLITLSEIRGQLTHFSAQSPENTRIATALLYSVENSYKGIRGRYETLVDPAFIKAKTDAEAELKAKIKADPKLAAEVGSAFDDLAKAQAQHEILDKQHLWLEERAGFRSELFGFARTIVRAAQERNKPNADRLRDYTDSRLAIAAKRVIDPRPVYPELEKLLLSFWLTKLRENLTADAPATKLFLGKESPQSLAEKLVASKLADPAYRKALWDGGLDAVKASDDPLIRYVLATDPASRAIRKEYEEKISAPTEAATQKIAKARFAIYGTATYPDATFSLRLSYGAVEGWNEKGTPVSPFTDFAGLWDRTTGKAPFDLPQRWVDAKDKLNGKTLFNFVTTNDIIGGNSGSPVINAKGDVVGAAFDGNIESLGGDYWYDGSVNRTVVVSTASITEALKKLYKQDGLVKELTSK